MTTQAAAQRVRPAGTLMLHPAVVAAVAVLVINDHVLKALYGSWWTGKLSDVAGLLFFPVLLASAGERVAAVAGRTGRADGRALALCAAVTAAVFAAVELVPLADDVYEAVMGLAQAPGRALLGIRVGPAAATADPTDLLALPAAAWGLLLLPRGQETSPSRRSR